MTNIHHEIGLVEIAGAEISPGDRWPEYSASFSAMHGEDRAIVLGSTTGAILAASGVSYLNNSFIESVRSFAEQAEPPIPRYHQTRFLSYAVRASQGVKV